MDIPKVLLRLVLGRRLPAHAGTLKVPSIDHPVHIRRDGYGIPTIEADTGADAWYGLGFCHGQDRPFQIEQLLRVARGTLAAWLGPDALPVDRLSRRIGFHRAAEQQWAVVSDEARRWIAAYAHGVNDGIRLGLPHRPHPFVLLGSHPTPFTGIDVLGVIKVLAFTLSNNWMAQLARMKILTEDGREALRALDGGYPQGNPVISPPMTPAAPAVDRLTEELGRWVETVGLGGASNNWALAASRTATGRPLLANDPHMGTTIPPHWYLAHVRTATWAVAGASIVGTPGIPAGHNGFAAWGLTNGMIDDTDLFIEAIGRDRRSVREGERFIPCEIQHEVIEVKGADPVEERVLITPRGPIISPALPGEWRALSMQATWLAPRPLRGLLYVHLTRSFEEFRQCFEAWPTPAQNVVYADTSGTLGWQLIGEAPQRRKGWGVLPAAGWDPEAGWEDEPVPFAAMPFDLDPAPGLIATANGKPTPEGEGPFLGTSWEEGYRQARLVEMLETRDDWTLEETQALQMDTVSLPWQAMRPVVLAIPAGTEAARRGLAMLADWDGEVRPDAPAATVFETFFTEITRTLLSAKAPKTAAWALGTEAVPLMGHPFARLWRIARLIELMQAQPDGWFAGGWPQAMAETLDRTVRALETRYGHDTERWAWGRVRPLTLGHIMGRQAPLDRIYNLGPFPWGGDQWTVAQARCDPGDPTANPSPIASLRMVIDVGNWDASRFVLPGGQSGNPLSPHYADQFPLWQRGEGIPIAWSPARVDATTTATLHLVPVR